MLLRVRSSFCAAVISSTPNPVSAKQKLSLLPSRGSFFLCLVLGLQLACLPIPANADSLEDEARALARKVASSTSGLSLNFEVQNYSTLSAALVARLTVVFQEELQRQGAKILPDKAAASVVLRFSQNLSEYLGIAQVQRGDNSETLFASLGTVEGTPTAEPSAVYSVHKELLLSQERPILDAAFGEDEKHIQVLGLQDLSTYELRGDQWKPTGTNRLPVQFAVGRELRGVLSPGTHSETVYAPGKSCQLSFAEQSWNCDKHEGPPPIRGVSVDLSKKKNGAWVSASQLSSDSNAAIVVTGTDGTARLYEEGPDPVATFSGWGAEIAGVKSGCGKGWQLLVTRSGDWTQADAIQAVEIQDRHANPVSPATEFPGPVLALRALGGSAEVFKAGDASAVAIVRNLLTGAYEVYRLTVTCTN